MNPYRGWNDDALDNEIQRLSGIVPENVYEGLVGYTVGESLELAEAEQKRRRGVIVTPSWEAAE